MRNKQFQHIFLQPDYHTIDATPTQSLFNCVRDNLIILRTLHNTSGLPFSSATPFSRSHQASTATMSSTYTENTSNMTETASIRSTSTITSLTSLLHFRRSDKNEKPRTKPRPQPETPEQRATRMQATCLA